MSDRIGNEIVGSVFAVNRYARYEGNVIWRFHSEYRAKNIDRAYHLDGRPCGLYRSVVLIDGPYRVVCVGESLDCIKRCVKDYLLKEAE